MVVKNEPSTGRRRRPWKQHNDSMSSVVEDSVGVPRYLTVGESVGSKFVNYGVCYLSIIIYCL